MSSKVLRKSSGVAFVITVGAAVVVSSAATPSGENTSFTVVAPETVLADVSFAEDVLPLLEAKCGECHGKPNERGVPWEEAGLNLLSYERVMQGSEFGTVVEAGSPDKSFLYTQVLTGDMPQEGEPLTDEEKNILKEWIEAGAPNN